MNYKEWTYNFDNTTSFQRTNIDIYTVPEMAEVSGAMPEYYNTVSQGMNIFEQIKENIINVENITIKNRVTKFMIDFMMILDKIQEMSNVFPALIFTEDEDSVFLEWVFKDFRIGFTFCENEDESMWFMVSNRKLESLSISGDLMISNYSNIITKAVMFAVENT